MPAGHSHIRRVWGAWWTSGGVLGTLGYRQWAWLADIVMVCGMRKFIIYCRSRHSTVA